MSTAEQPGQPEPVEQPVPPMPSERERTRSPRRGMCAAILTLQAITVALASPVMIWVGGVAPAPALSIGLGLAVACLLVAGMLRREWAYSAGWALQVLTIGTGFLVGTMFFLGAIFALLWGLADYLGRRIERERAEAFAAFDAEHDPGI